MKEKPKGKSVKRLVRHGWGVEIARKDGTAFLAASGQGILPAIFAQRHSAVVHKNELKAHNFNCRVVAVTFTDPRSDRSA